MFIANEMYQLHIWIRYVFYINKYGLFTELYEYESTKKLNLQLRIRFHWLRCLSLAFRLPPLLSVAKRNWATDRIGHLQTH